MRIVTRASVVLAKAARLCGLMVMIRCFGPEGTACVLWGLRATAVRLLALGRRHRPV